MMMRCVDCQAAVLYRDGSGWWCDDCERWLDGSLVWAEPEYRGWRRLLERALNLFGFRAGVRRPWRPCSREDCEYRDGWPGNTDPFSRHWHPYGIESWARSWKDKGGCRW